MRARHKYTIHEYSSVFLRPRYSARSIKTRHFNFAILLSSSTLSSFLFTQITPAFDSTTFNYLYPPFNMPKSTYSDRARTPRQSHHSYPYTVEESLTMAEWRTDARGETIGQSKTMRKQYNHHDVAQGGLVPLFQGFHQNLLEGGNANGSRYAGSRASSRGGGSIKQIGWHGANEEEEVRSTTGSHVKNWVNGQGKQGTYSVQGGKKGNGSIVGSTRHGGPVPGSKIGGSTRYGGSIRGSKTGGTPRYGGSAAAGGQSVSIAAKHLKERNILFSKLPPLNIVTWSPYRCLDY